jgi:peptide chain release factor 2
MLVDILKEEIKSIAPDILTIQTYWKQADFEQKYKELHEISQSELFWQNPQQTDISKRLQKIKTIREQYLETCKAYYELSELIDLFATDEEELQKLHIELNRFRKRLHALKIELLLSGQHDASPCFLSINAGAGGTESQDWASILLRMYMRFCEQEGLSAELIDEQMGEEAGIKSATLYIKGENAYGLLKSERGVHRLVRVSPFDANKRRHTSFAAVLVLPEEAEIAIDINPNDLRIDTYRASGAGGQHVNKTDSAIRITHLPTNIVVQCQTQRSQTQNKVTAMKMLAAKLAQKAEDERSAQHAALEKKKIEWGSQIRSYVLHPYKMVKDHRTEHESPQPDLVLDGNLMPFIEAYLIGEGHAK